MKNTLFLVLIILSVFTSNAQSVPKPYWAILGDNAQVSVKYGSHKDMLQIVKEMENRDVANYVVNNLKKIVTNDMITDVKFGAKEAVLILDSLDNGVLYAVDPIGRMIYIKGDVYAAIYSTQKSTPGVGSLTNDFILENGRKLIKGLFLWVTEIDSENEKAVVQIGKNETIKIPLSKLEMFRTEYTQVPDSWKFKDVAK